MAFFFWLKHVCKLRSCISHSLSLSRSTPSFLELTEYEFFFFVPQCVACECDLGGSSSGAEVRIRNNQLYCNDCYLRFKCKRANQGENFLSFKETTGSHAFPWTCDHLPLKLLAVELQVLGILVCPLQRGFSERVSAQHSTCTRAGRGAKGLERDVCPRARPVSCAVCSESGETANDSRIQTNQNRSKMDLWCRL